MDNQVRQKVQDYIGKLQSLTEILIREANDEQKKEWMDTIQCLVEDLEVYGECYPVD